MERVAGFDYSPSKTPCYYQINAIDRTVEAIAGGQDRVLIVLDIDNAWQSLDSHATEWHTFPMHRVFKTCHFARWMRKSGLTDPSLCNAVAEMADGLIDTELGGDVVKKRVAQQGRGKRGGARTLVATRTRDRGFFAFGFEKNERANVTPTELEALQTLAGSLLSLTPVLLDNAVGDGTLLEICHEH